MTYPDVIELLQIALQKYADFNPIVSEAIGKAKERALEESLKPPPRVDYKSLRSEFHRELHSMDRLRPSQQYTHAYRIAENLRPLISEASCSVNENSPREIVEEAMICLQKFAGQLGHIMEYEVEKALLRGDSSLLIKISDSMLPVARILKGKGGSNDTELKEKIMKYKVWDGTDGLEG